MELLLVYATCAIFVVSCLYLLRLFAAVDRNLPPGSRPLPLVGNLLDLGAQPHRSLARLAARHGPLIALRLGAVTTVVASSADAARDVLQRHDAALSARSVPDAARARAHDEHSVGWLPPGSPRWRALRKVCSAELFAPRRLDAHRSLRRDKVRRLASHVERLAREGAVVEVGRVAFTTALNMLSGAIFSADLADLDDRGASGAFKGVIEEFTVAVGVPNMSDFFPVLAPLVPQRLRTRLGRVFDRLHAIFDEQIERRIQERGAGEPPKNDFLDLLLDYRGAEEGQGFGRRTLLSLLTDLFSAGSDTSAATVEWAMAELQAVVKETFRLHPPAPLLLPRQAETATEIRGYKVPRGASVLVNVWAIGQDPELWSEPEKFMPERFLEKEMDFRGKDFELLPFGSGRRICPGMPLADRMVHLMLATLLHGFEWRLPADAGKNGVNMSENFGMILGLATPLQAIAKPI